ncbi:hypothetical protein EDC01DRAFT_758102 [Geopyxis carbonaria]|nr:hypothetical protein EDC01DRAFT_758102 [Geopyxis carbonaria]
MEAMLNRSALASCISETTWEKPQSGKAITHYLKVLFQDQGGVIRDQNWEAGAWKALPGVVANDAMMNTPISAVSFWVGKVLSVRVIYLNKAGRLIMRYTSSEMGSWESGDFVPGPVIPAVYSQLAMSAVHLSPPDSQNVYKDVLLRIVFQDKDNVIQQISSTQFAAGVPNTPWKYDTSLGIGTPGTSVAVLQRPVRNSVYFQEPTMKFVEWSQETNQKGAWSTWTKGKLNIAGTYAPGAAITAVSWMPVHQTLQNLNIRIIAVSSDNKATLTSYVSGAWQPTTTIINHTITGTALSVLKWTNEYKYTCFFQGVGGAIFEEKALNAAATTWEVTPELVPMAQ